MTRSAALVAVALWLIPASVGAQITEFTVNTVSAEIHNSPSTGSPIIDHAPRGTIVEVTRELGSWVKVAWPSAPEGAYLHVSSGSIRRGVQGAEPAPAANAASVANTASPAGAASARAAAPSPAPAPAHTPQAATSERGQGRMPGAPSVGTGYVQPPSHVVGIGGQFGGPALGFGATARAWSRKRLGVQFVVSHSELAAVANAGRVSAIQLAPSVLYSLKDHVTDFVVVRLYFGGGAAFQRQTYTAAPGALTSTTDNGVGVQAFGGSEFTFASLPRFAVSADFGYQQFQTPFPGFDLGGLGVFVSGHWYVK